MLLRHAAILTLLPLSLAGCGVSIPGLGGEAAAPVAPAHIGAPTVSPLDAPIEVAGAQTTLGTANAATAGAEAFTIQGAGFVGAIKGQNGAIARQGGATTQVRLRRVDFGGGVEFVGEAAGRTFTANLRGSACQGASGGTWPLVATIKLAGNTLTGCAAPTGAEPAVFAATLPTIRPVAAAKPKAPAPKKPAAAATPASVEPATATPATSTPATSTPATSTPATSTPLPSAPEPSVPVPATAPTDTAPAPATSTTPEPATPTPATQAPANPAPAATPPVIPPVITPAN